MAASRSTVRTSDFVALLSGPRATETRAASASARVPPAAATASTTDAPGCSSNVPGRATAPITFTVIIRLATTITSPARTSGLSLAPSSRSDFPAPIDI